MTVLEWIKAKFEDAVTWAEMDLAPWLESFLARLTHGIVETAMPYVATAAAELGVEITSGKPAHEVLQDMHDTAQLTLQKLEAAGISAAAHEVQATVNAFFATTKPGTAATAASTAVTEAEKSAPAADEPAGEVSHEPVAGAEDHPAS